ncbi:MAG TPA: PD-(D/E)XK nuclease family protein, partial [Dehalococcoidia bacterium]|nr:PD-(D/E)XK nuclease family protein [Dehalococcoidia bacterium]
FGSAVSSEEYLEQFVEAEGIVGKIDIYENIPIEVKTTSTLVSTEDLVKYRPTYVEQLGIYCAMVNSSQGKVIVYQRHDSAESPQAPLIAYYVTFPDLEAIRDEMRQRRDLLVQALISNDPGNLPICAWFNRGCDYSAVCDCRTTSVPLSYKIAELAGQIQVDDTTCQQLLAKLAKPQPSQLLRTNDVVFPRKAYFKRAKPQEIAIKEGLPQEKEERLRSMDKLGFLDALRDSLRYGAPGEVQNIPIQCATLSDLVRIRQNLPTIERVTKFQSLVERQRLAWTFPHYFLRLGFECALTDHPQGRLLLYYANVPREDAKLMVYDATFRNLHALKTEALRRVELLEKATSPLQLPKCPSWMCPNCSYKFECGEA